MSKELRHVTVSVGVLYDPALGFLLFRNERWNNQYAFPMKKPHGDQDLAEVALTALDEGSPIVIPDAAAQPAALVGAFGQSDALHTDTYYEYHVFDLKPPAWPVPGALPAGAKWFPYADLILDTDNVTWSTRQIASALVEFQEACVAVIARNCGADREYLLVYHPAYGYFFPSARRTTGALPEELAVHAVQRDCGYGAPMIARRCQEVPDAHVSHRFGNCQRRYLFHICRIEIPGLDFCQPNPLTKALDAFHEARVAAGWPSGSHGYWKWFTEAELRGDPEVSETMAPLLHSVLRCAERG